MRAVSDGWQPTIAVSTARRRAAMLANARRFFESRNVLEVDVPSISLCTVSDPNIESIRAILRRDKGRIRYLQTSPEYFMKRLLCSGFPDIYSIGRVYRDGEAGRRHQPEFTMVEWYRREYELEEMIDESCAFVTQLLDRESLDVTPVIIEYLDAVRERAGIDPLAAPCSSLADACGADDRLRNAIGDNRDAWLDLLVSTKVVPTLAIDRLTVIRHYPASQAALARLCPEDSSIADRFEVFLGNMELANGYVELRDAAEQERRWQEDLRVRRERGLDAVPLDARLLAALRHGLPACSGVAVGFDRLVMLAEGADDIARVQSFSFEDAEPS
ncbi:MAG: EF-P lysine aminoacylase EpmA [Woeseiaceae bacterium]